MRTGGSRKVVEVREGIHQPCVIDLKKEAVSGNRQVNKHMFQGLFVIEAFQVISVSWRTLLPSIYSQECLCWVDTSQRTALPCSVLPDKVYCYGGTFYWFLPWCKWNKWHHWLPVSLSVLYPSPFFHIECCCFSSSIPALCGALFSC